MKVLTWILRLVPAFLMGQTLFFKLTGAPESIYIFETLGVEPWGRYATALLELVAVVLLLIPRRTVLGAALGAGLMAGAIGSHLTQLGIVVQDDGGLLFGMAVVTLACCLALVVAREAERHV